MAFRLMSKLSVSYFKGDDVRCNCSTSRCTGQVNQVIPGKNWWRDLSAQLNPSRILNKHYPKWRFVTKLKITFKLELSPSAVEIKARSLLSDHFSFIRGEPLSFSWPILPFDQMIFLILIIEILTLTDYRMESLMAL